jgi:plastocyanin
LQVQKDGEWVYILYCGVQKNGSVTQTLMEDKNMRKLTILASGLAVLIGLWVTGTKVATGQVDSNDATVALVDNCDPATFNAVVGPGTCALKHRRDTTFPEFFGLLFSPLAANIIGHPAWNFSPGYISVRAGQTVQAKNAGGELHTFTEVTAFGGGFFPPLNGVDGPAGTIPLVPAPACVAPGGATTLAPGATARINGLAPGVHKFQCCIHPWMRAVVDVE